MRIINLDEAEVRFEKCRPGSSCKWFVTVGVQKGDHYKLLLAIKLNKIPYCWFDLETEGAVGSSSLVKDEVLKNSDTGLVDVKPIHN
jgi:hypothetical protein